MGMKPKVTAARIMYIAAVQIVVTTVGFILYKRPYLWAWAALEYYKEGPCGSDLAAVISKYNTYTTENKAQVHDKVERYQRNCEENYLDSFNEQFNEKCLTNCKSAFIQIPLASCFLILGIVAALHWAPFHSKTLKKPGFIFAFFFSLILVSINIGQIISIVIPLINPNATPRTANSVDIRDQCGFASEVVALALIIGSSLLSALIAAFVIRLYVIRVRYQDDHIDDLNMGNEGVERKRGFLEREHWKEKEKEYSKAKPSKSIKTEKKRESSADSGWGTPNSRYKGLT